MRDYFSILVFIGIALCIGVLVLCLGFWRGRRFPNAAKNSPYECGFDTLESAPRAFDVRFYLLAILFILFDVETLFLFPWTLCLRSTPESVFWSMMIFLLILTIGFVYEWRKGALEWE